MLKILLKSFLTLCLSKQPQKAANTKLLLKFLGIACVGGSRGARYKGVTEMFSIKSRPAKAPPLRELISLG